jgi:hypothetical protein
MQKLVVVVTLALFGCTGKAYENGPNDGSILCTLSNEGYYVQNQAWSGFVIRRAPDADLLCAQHYRKSP